ATDAATNRDICRHMGVPEIALENVGRFAAANHVALVVDAIFGTGLDRPVTGPAADAITCINALRRPVLAVDIPSGMDADTGAALGCAVVAACTVTLVGPK